MDNFQQILQNSKSLIDKTIYSYLFMLMKYIFFWKNGIEKEIRDGITKKIKAFTDKINQSIIKKKEKFIKIEPYKEVYTFNNLNNILDFIQTQNTMYSGDIIEGILIKIFSYAFETSKTNEFGKYLYINIAKLRDPSNLELPEWFKKAKNLFQADELKDFKKLLENDFYVNDNIKPNQTIYIIYVFLIEILKIKFNLINAGKSTFLNYLNKEKVQLTPFFLDKFKSMKDYNPSNISMIDKDFMGNSIAYIYYCLFDEKKGPPIKIIRCFLISIYIYYQNAHSPLMQYIEPYISVDENDDQLVSIPFTYSIRGAFIEGRFANIIMSPIKIEPRISNLHLGQNNIREWGLFELGKAITMNKNIKSVNLKISLLRSYFLDFFISGLGFYDNYSIEEINLSMNYLKEDCGDSLVTILSHFKNLKTLNISSNELKGSAKYIFIYLRNQYRKGKCPLENLYLNNCLLDDSSFYELSELLKSKFCKLKKLSISLNNKSNVINFLKKIKYNKYLSELNISKCGLQSPDVDDICRIISNTNIKQLNLFKNDFNNFNYVLNIIFRSKLVKKEKELNENKKFVIDRSSSLMTLDLSNNMFYFLNEYYIKLINEFVKENNSTIGCLDLSHIFFGLYPDKSVRSERSMKYSNEIEVHLAKIIKENKNKFGELLHNKYLKETAIKQYEDKRQEDKLYYKLEIIDNLIQDILKKKENDYHQYLYLKEHSKTILNEIISEKEDYKELIKKEGINDEHADPEKNEKYINHLIDYISYNIDKEELDEYNRNLGGKKLILI